MAKERLGGRLAFAVDVTSILHTSHKQQNCQSHSPGQRAHAELQRPQSSGMLGPPGSCTSRRRIASCLELRLCCPADYTFPGSSFRRRTVMQDWRNKHIAVHFPMPFLSTGLTASLKVHPIEPNGRKGLAIPKTEQHSHVHSVSSDSNSTQ